MKYELTGNRAFGKGAKAIFSTAVLTVVVANSFADDEELAEKMTDVHRLDRYVVDPSPVVQERIEEWRDLKFGLLMHWGTYSQLGIVESWPICPEDEGWCIPPTVDDYNAFKKTYESLPYTFNPTQFDPERWAKAAAGAGMKYMVFTTKHHDGFCMFDSQYTDYKITNERVPFSSHPKANVTKELFSAFRDEGLWLGAYFSKPDWNSNDFWWRRFPAKDRNPNYDVERYPERWDRFVEFTHNQVMELVEDYGGIDLLWFDGGWVKKVEYGDEPLPSLPAGYKIAKEPNLDIRMDELVQRTRAVNPDLIVVDRAVAGKNQNYLTPENQVPHEMLPYPWESCIILGGGWSYSLHAEFMSSREIVHMLSDIVSKGGNLLLNIGPSPAGTWYESTYERLEDMGEWMDVHSEAIYSTRPIAPYFKDQFRYTRGKDGTIYAIYLLEEGETELPKSLALEGLDVGDASLVTLLGKEDAKVTLKKGKLALSKDAASDLPSPYAVVFKIK